MSVSRLPRQHPKHPHCAACDRDLPSFDMNFWFVSEELGETQVEAVTFHVVCPCGTRWDIRKKILKREEKS